MLQAKGYRVDHIEVYGELFALTLESIQQREGHWAIADLLGKGGHVRTVPVPA